MKKAILAVSVLMLLFTFPTLAPAGGGGHEKYDGQHKKMHGHGKKHKSYAHRVLAKAEELHLSDDQLGNIMRVHLQHRKVRKELRKELHHSMSQAHQELMDPTTEDEVIRRTAKQHTDTLNELVKNALEERRKVNSVLTEEQKEQLLLMKKKCEQRNANSR